MAQTATGSSVEATERIDVRWEKKRRWRPLGDQVMMTEELKLKSDSESKRSASESGFANELHPYPKMTRSF